MFTNEDYDNDKLTKHSFETLSTEWDALNAEGVAIEAKMREIELDFGNGRISELFAHASVLGVIAEKQRRITSAARVRQVLEGEQPVEKLMDLILGGK